METMKSSMLEILKARMGKAKVQRKEIDKERLMKVIENNPFLKALKEAQDRKLEMLNNIKKEK